MEKCLGILNVLFAICYLEDNNKIYKVSFYSKTETMIFNIIKVHKTNIKQCYIKYEQAINIWLEI